MRRLVQLLLIAALACISIASVAADGGPTAAYQGDGAQGVLLLTAGNDGTFTVRAEQPSGGYAIVSQGDAFAGQTVAVAVSGGGVPGNSTPAWMVEFRAPGFDPVIVGVEGPKDDELWDWE